MHFISANNNQPHPVINQDDYEPCKSCTKEGKTIRGDFPRPDYILGAFARASGILLNQFGLPYPNTSNIFRGTAHDMLFQKQGLVTRIGPMNHTSILHPAILQPLIHANDNNIGEELTITISAGIRSGYRDLTMSTEDIEDFMEDTHQKTSDVAACNVGMTDNKITVILDLDDQYGGTLCNRIRSKKKKRLEHHMRDGTPWYIAARHTMEDVYGDHRDFGHYIQAYDYHQPLRAEIYDAVTAPHPDDKRQKLSDFSGHCASLVKAKDNNGLALYRPWTGKPIDNGLKKRSRRVSLA